MSIIMVVIVILLLLIIIQTLTQTRSSGGFHCLIVLKEFSYKDWLGFALFENTV